MECSIGSEFGGKVDRSELDARIDFLMALLSRRFSARRDHDERILPEESDLLFAICRNRTVIRTDRE